MKPFALFFLTILISLLQLEHVAAATYEYTGFEETVPANWTTSKGTLEISSLHYKLGSESLKWNYETNGKIIVNNPIGANKALDTYKGGLMIWIYNETPVDDVIKFEYSKDDQVHYWFNYNINFKGWRACWIRFDQDMQGTKGTNAINKLTINAPSTVGSLYFDRYIHPDSRINDRITGGAQMPDINPDISQNNHWGALWHWYSTRTYDIELVEPSSSELKEINTIRTRLLKNLAGDAPGPAALSNAKTTVSSYKIVANDSASTGAPYVCDDEYNLEIGDIKMQIAGDVMLTLARGYYHNISDFQAQVSYFKLWNHIIDQGFTVGSGIGTNHHYGYRFREMATSFLLMYDYMLTRRKQKLLIYHPVLEYWSGIQEFREPVNVDDLQGVLDAWNTMTYARLIAAVTHPDEKEQLRSLKAFKRWYESSMEYSSGTKGGFKEDGSLFHHGGHYPAYANGAISSLGEVINILSNTSFQLNGNALLRLKNSLLAFRFHSNKNDWAIGLSGRHPLAGKMSSSVHKAFYYTALAGDAVSGESVDKELAEACLRLTSTSEIVNDLSSKGFVAEPAPNGFKEMNWAALGLYRQSDWLATLKGFNKHVWNTEIYTGDNLYGRYQSYGTVQITGPKGAAASGFKYNGWDWNRNPGTTSIQLPFDKLRQKNGFATSIFQGEEKFAGASSFDGQNGVFSMVLNELSFNDYTPNHKAHKSVFCFGNKLICLGSGISNTNASYPTETTIFQCGLDRKDAPISHAYLNESLDEISQFPYQGILSNIKAKLAFDSEENGYYFPSQVPVNFYRQEQSSPNDKTHAYTSGNFATAVISHGKAPSDASYHYTVLPQSNAQKLSEFAQNMESETTAAYTILHHDKKAHVITDQLSQITAYAIFDYSVSWTKGLVKKATKQCIVMYKPLDADTNTVELSICNPDLNLQLQPGDLTESSQAIYYSVTLNGAWEIEETKDEISIQSQEVDIQDEIISTTLSLVSKKGKTLHVRLKRKKSSTDLLLNTNNANGFWVYYDKQNKIIQLNNIPEKTEMIKVYNSVGSELLSISSIQSNSFNIDSSDLPKGIYFVSLSSSKATRLINKVVL